MDGTLLESEALARACFLKACEDLGWADPDISIYNQCVGSTWENTKITLLEGFGPTFPVDDLQERWRVHYYAFIEHHPVDVKPGIMELIQVLTHHEIPMAVATSSGRESATIKLDKAGLLPHFAGLVCGGETTRGKPFADPYLHATQMIQRQPATCWALEDSEHGVRSALAAGLQVIHIPDELPPGKNVLALSDVFLDDARPLAQRVSDLVSKTP